jgi:hypothetical protein
MVLIGKTVLTSSSSNIEIAFSKGCVPFGLDSMPPSLQYPCFLLLDR